MADGHSPLQSDDPDEDQSTNLRRASERRDVSIPAVLRDGKGQNWDGTIINISEQGCGVQVAGHHPPEEGAILTVRFGGLEAQAACTAWSKEGLAGFSFMNPLYPAILEDIVTRNPPS
jgi:hypothetical protein